ncbi:Fe(3+) ABC transporter substrate-binding protein [Advenella sp. WQ 585]|uniref:Fe(3+) ABC transporter substrate-binding protein n=2 Tax=Advenella mandrilli TaxID=2800330 RepID=A0ABS1EC68_9BURK|nr:Fe(3+) ABC transporter substrate-binding protein [Advenella mandrilli]
MISRNTILKKSLFTMSAMTISMSALAAGEVNLYTTREPRLIQPILEAFEKDTGIKTNTVFIKDGLPERIKSEGERSPADVLMTVDIGRLLDVVDQDLVQPVDSKTLKEIIPENLRAADNTWFAFSLRDRVLYAAKELNLETFTYEDLADPKWKNKICIRSGQHPYNTSLIAAMIAHNGPEKTEEWLKGVKNNLARKAAGGDREVARDILGGICDIGIGNAYYVGRMKNAEPGSEQYQWGEAIKVIRPTFATPEDSGTHVNITGAAIAKYSPNHENAVKFLEYLVSDQAQQLYSKTNYEYPIRKGVEMDPVMTAIGELKVDSLPVTEIAKFRKQASELVDKVGFDN